VKKLKKAILNWQADTMRFVKIELNVFFVPSMESFLELLFRHHHRRCPCIAQLIAIVIFDKKECQKYKLMSQFRSGE